MPSFTKLVLSAALALVTCATLTSALPTDTGALQPRLYDTMAPAEYGSLLKKARAKRAALKQRVAEAQLVERNLVERDSDHDNSKDKGKDKGNNGKDKGKGKDDDKDHGHGHGPGHGNGNGGNNGDHNPGHGGPRPNDPENCGRWGRVCPESYNGIGEPICKHAICSLKCPRGRKPKTKHGYTYCA